jgi:hypothetical protein
VDKFILKFNSQISKGIEHDYNTYILNDILDKIPTLNDVEFDYAIGLAMQQGWILERFDDEHYSVSYKMVKR